MDKKSHKKDYVLKDEQDDEIIYDLNKTDPDLIKKKGKAGGGAAREQPPRG